MALTYSAMFIFVMFIVESDKIDELKKYLIEEISHSFPYEHFTESEVMRLIIIIVIIAIILGAAVYALVVYMFMAVTSLYRKLSDENQQNGLIFVRQSSSPLYYPEIC